MLSLSDAGGYEPMNLDVIQAHLVVRTFNAGVSARLLRSAATIHAASFEYLPLMPSQKVLTRKIALS